MNLVGNNFRSSTIPFYKTVLAFRALWVVVITVAVQALFPLGSARSLIIFSGIAGVITSSRMAHSRLTHAGFGAVLAMLIVSINLLAWFLQTSFAALGLTSFLIDRVMLHMGTCLISGIAWAIATWIFWRVRSALVLEVLAVFFTAILLFSGHRGFHLDRPKILNSIAWRLGVDHLTMLLIIGSGLVVVALLYLYVASLAIRPRIEAHTVRIATPRRRLVSASVLIALLLGALYGVQQMVYGFYNESMLARVANGVGMNSDPGVSPLSFQSALGSTNQPAGLVRLEGDYSNNPFSPMMYLRESALSAFNGKEMVFAGRAYDDDLPVTSTRDSFSRQEDAELGERTPLIQSIYLLADHDHAFAVDYPISIVQLKNPRPNRFKSSYRAYSIAPAYTLSTLSSKDVGDPRWSEDVRKHYLAPHPDARYGQLAQEVTKDATTAIGKVEAITQYLSKTAIYTLTPRHEVKPDEDPVAPFLFGDHRGYCVHFAHAIVYMVRALGIPARIGTGYLTDLSQAKDGHVLLRMSDRHAWAETFVSGIGWVPFDVQPEQVESHAETQVDTKLLEELMGVLEPGEEVLPSDSIKDEAGVSEPEEFWVPSRNQILTIFLSLLLVGVVGKLMLRHAWRFAPTRHLAVKWGYIGLASQLYDLGISRQFGETRTEFAARSPQGLLSEVAQLVVNQAYTQGTHAHTHEVKATIKRAFAKYHELPRRTRLLAAVNPSSLLKATSGLLSGGGW